MQLNERQLAALCQNIEAQFRRPMSNMNIAFGQILSGNNGAGKTDTLNPIFNQSFYQSMRMIRNLASAGFYFESDRPLKLRNIDIVQFVQSLCAGAEDLARAMQLELTFFSPESRHLCALNPEAIEQIVYQLLSNALKFTPAKGSVTVELQFSRKQVFLSVSDTGCGISQELLPTLFERCFHADQKEQRGVGLGLALCRRIAQRHGGSIVVESCPGRGSQFTFSIPNRQTDLTVLAEPSIDYYSGFDSTLCALSDALPYQFFLRRGGETQQQDEEK